MTLVALTTRLALRELTLDDAAAFHALNDDPEVLRYTGDAPFGSVAAARAFLADYDSYATRGFGRWAVTQRDDGVFLGWCGLGRRSDVDDVDLGFRFFRAHWGGGYATEAGAAALQLGFERYALPRIVGRALPDNLASRRVLEKLGLRRIGDETHDGLRWTRYLITAAEHARPNAGAVKPVYNRPANPPRRQRTPRD